MPRTLSASPIGYDAAGFFPGPLTFLPQYPNNAYAGVLGAIPDTALVGTFPASDTYPASDDYPGRGNTLGASGASPRTLSEAPA